MQIKQGLLRIFTTAGYVFGVAAIVATVLNYNDFRTLHNNYTYMITRYNKLYNDHQALNEKYKKLVEQYEKTKETLDQYKAAAADKLAQLHEAKDNLSCVIKEKTGLFK